MNSATIDIFSAIRALTLAGNLSVDQPAWASDYDEATAAIEEALDHIARARNEIATQKALFVRKEAEDEARFASNMKATPYTPTDMIRGGFGVKR